MDCSGLQWLAVPLSGEKVARSGWQWLTVHDLVTPVVFTSQKHSDIAYFLNVLLLKMAYQNHVRLDLNKDNCLTLIYYSSDLDPKRN